jgi:NAD(P)-dependent dehydrogenase (short-subunit alcohol dehydrogenase family)
MTTHKVAIITGASRNIGAGLVAGYRRRDWSVVTNAQTIPSSRDSNLLTVAGDISQPITAGRIVDAALDRFGRIDTLVNSAGVCISKPFTDYTVTDYAAVTDVNLSGFFWLTQRAIGEMARRYGGHVINIISAADVPGPGLPAVLGALADGGLFAATRSLAIEYASRGIRVNAVSPGLIQAPMQPECGYEGRLPLPGRMSRISDVVDSVLFLETSPFINGEILYLNGGPA